MFHIDFISYFVKIIIDNVYIQKLDSLPNKYSVRLQVLNFLMEAFVMSFYNRFFEIIEGSFDFPISFTFALLYVCSRAFKNFSIIISLFLVW